MAWLRWFGTSVPVHLAVGGTIMAQTLLNRVRAKIGMGGIIVGIIIAAALAFIAASIVSTLDSPPVNIEAGQQFSCTVLSIYDGDGPINCAERDSRGQPVSVRLRGIEAREADDTCQLKDQCPKASGAEAKAALMKLAVGRLNCTSFGPSYNRVDARCRTATGTDISCEMVRSGAASRWPEYDPGGSLIPCVPRKP